MAEHKQNLVNSMEHGGAAGAVDPPPPSYYPSLPAAYPGGPTPTTTVVTTPPCGTAAYGGILGAHAVTLECPNCRVTMQTRTESRIGGYAWMIFGIMAIIGTLIVIP